MKLLLNFILFIFLLFAFLNCTNNYARKSEECECVRENHEVVEEVGAGGPVVENLPANERDTGSIAGWGTKIPHAVGRLRPCTATGEAYAL